MCKECGEDTAYLPVHCRVEVQLWELANLLVVYHQLGVSADCAGHNCKLEVTKDWERGHRLGRLYLFTFSGQDRMS